MEAVATQALSNAKSISEEVAGKWFVTFMWRSLLIPPGFLYAIPILDFYIMLGWFSQNPAFHQLKRYQVIALVVINAAVIIAFLVLIFLILQVLCDPWSLSGLGLRFVGLVNSNYDFCGALSN